MRSSSWPERLTNGRPQCPPRVRCRRTSPWLGIAVGEYQAVGGDAQAATLEAVEHGRRPEVRGAARSSRAAMMAASEPVGHRAAAVPGARLPRACSAAGAVERRAIAAGRRQNPPGSRQPSLAHPRVPPPKRAAFWQRTGPPVRPAIASRHPPQIEGHEVAKVGRRFAFIGTHGCAAGRKRGNIVLVGGRRLPMRLACG